MSKRILLVGGTRHGQWMDVERRSWNVKIPKANPVNIFSMEDTDFGYEIYTIEKVPISFSTLTSVVECGIHEDLPFASTEKDRAIVSAIFQRDIAQTFKEGGWGQWG